MAASGDDMQISIQLRSDKITPDLRLKLVRVRRLEPVLRAMGQAVVNIARRAFGDPALRPSPWAARKTTSSKPILVKSGLLKRSPRVVDVTGRYVKVGTDRPYAAVHQFGSKKSKGRGSGIPARPYFPLSGMPDRAVLTPKAERDMLNAAGRTADRLLK